MVESNQYGDFEHYKVFDEIDISKYIKRGKNTLAVLVWHFGEDFQRYKTAQAGVIFEITSQDKLLLCSDEHILARRSRTYVSGRCKKITNQLGFSFLYDATKEDGWEYNGFPDGGFAVAVNKNCSFYSRPACKLQRRKEKESRVIKNGGNYYLVDLGEESVGLHGDLAEYIIQTAKRCAASGEPMIRNLEYAYPHSGYVTVNDEFLLGEDILVAPQLKKGMSTRQVIIPDGIWEDAAGKKYRKGNYMVDTPITVIPVFKRIGK